MTDRSELVERLVRIDATTHCLICLSGPERDLIVAALRAPALPSEEEIRRAFENGYASPGSIGDHKIRTEEGLRAVLALVAKSKGCT
jgi:hypothetical protein